jgi:hypothetical protein
MALTFDVGTLILAGTALSAGLFYFFGLLVLAGQKEKVKGDKGIYVLGGTFLTTYILTPISFVSCFFALKENLTLGVLLLLLWAYMIFYIPCLKKYDTNKLYSSLFYWPVLVLSGLSLLYTKTSIEMILSVLVISFVSLGCLSLLALNYGELLLTEKQNRNQTAYKRRKP